MYRWLREIPRLQLPVCGMIILLFVICGHRVFGHGPITDNPSDKELSKIQPSLSGSLLFLQTLTEKYKNHLTDTELPLLKDITGYLNQMRSFQDSKDDPSKQGKIQLAEYYRWQAERHLLALLKDHAHLKQLDYLKRDAKNIQKKPIVVGSFYQTILLHVKTGAGPASFSVQEWDLIDEKQAQHKTVDLTSGNHYVLLNLRNMPTEQTLVYITFRQTFGNRVSFTDVLTLQPEPLGQFAINVVDESGNSVPVLLQIRSKEERRLWEPAGAVDLRRVLNDVVPFLDNPDKGYEFYLPGDRRGHYWIIKPPIEMPLPEGNWDIRVLRGLEYRPLRKTVSVKRNSWTRLTLETERWTDMPSRGWYAGDDHVHARLMNSEDAQNLLDYAQATDVNITNILEMGDVMRTYYIQRGFGKEYRIQRGNHWLIPGQEDPRSILGHAIGLNLKAKVRDLNRYLSNDWVARQIHAQGGLYGHTHVGPNACFVHREMALFTPHEIVDFNSIMQAALGTELYYNFLNLGYQMTASAGADTPYGGTVGAVRTYAYTGKTDSFKPDDWFDAVKQGHTFVTNGPMLDFTIDEAFPGDELSFDQDAEVKISAKAWGDSGWSAPVRLRIIRFGQPIEEIQSSDVSQKQLQISKRLRVGHGCWVAAHAIGHDGSEAHSTPIYLTRKGFRRWDRVTAKKLIYRQLDVLDEIEGEVKRAENLIRENPHSFDYWSRRTAEQAEQVREMVARTRKHYLNLQTIYRDETKRMTQYSTN